MESVFGGPVDDAVSFNGAEELLAGVVSMDLDFLAQAEELLLYIADGFSSRVLDVDLRGKGEELEAKGEWIVHHDEADDE